MEFSFQLYSARNFLPWEQILKTVSDLGYSQVEGFGGVFEEPDTFRAQLDAVGLTMPSGHFSIDALEKDFDRVIEQSEKLGINAIYCPFLEEGSRPEDSAGWTVFAKRLAAINTAVKATGRRFGWHNHHFEFLPLADGALPQDIILQQAPDIDWEADIAWIIRGGGDPLEWIERYGSRISAVHVKDIAPTGSYEDEDGWADVGHGIVAWRNIMRALKENSTALYYVMEHDNPNDFERFAKRSIIAARSIHEVQNA